MCIRDRLRTYIHHLPPPRMLFSPLGDPFHRDMHELRSNPVSPWAGPKAILDEVEFAIMEPKGADSVICVVAGREDAVGNCLEAVPECLLDPSTHRWRLSEFTNVHRRAVLGNSDGTPPWTHPDPAAEKYVWAGQGETCSQTGESVFLSWMLFKDPNGPSPPM
eukprot:8772657-Alexandrium_andersonii.AAC.1